MAPSVLRHHWLRFAEMLTGMSSVREKPPIQGLLSDEQPSLTWLGSIIQPLTLFPYNRNTRKQLIIQLIIFLT